MKIIPSKTVSVIVPAYNDTVDLERCLEALNVQTARDSLEIVISLDGGDHLPERIAAMADRVVEGRHSGPAAARNRGWKASTGDLVLFTDSDCIPYPDWAEQMVRVLNRGADAVKGVYSGGGDRIIQRLAQIEFDERYKLLSNYETIDMIDTYSAGYRRCVLERTGGFDESFPFPDHEDVDLSYRMAEEGYMLRFAPEAKVSHRHRESWRAYFRTKFSRGRWRMKIVRRYPLKAGADTYTPLCMKIQIILCPLLLPALLMLFAAPLYLALWGWLFTMSTIPLVLTAFRSDSTLVLIVPFFAFWRGCALFSGLCRGIFTSKEVDE
ncbi:MAG: glycosyltransferase [Candidatus Aegiribacteria sp.]|nr:glycosyltransferase [Candidatus Aegiribacteria sp.]